MPNNILIKYGSKTPITAAVAGLASDATTGGPLTGIESSIIDNTVDGYSDILISGKVTTGTTPVAAKQIEIWAVAWDGANWPDVFDGTTSGETITSSELKNAICVPIKIMATNATSDRAYHFTAASVRTAFGGELPSKFVLFIAHNTGVNLNATAGNHEFSYQGVYPQVQ